MSEDQFDWASSESVAVHEQPSIAVYQNPYGQVVLRRERSWDEDDDCFIPIARENVLTVIRAILVAADMGDAKLYRDCGGNEYFGSCEDIEWPDQNASACVLIEQVDSTLHLNQAKPKDKTAAERQRRHRANKAKPDRDTVTVTPAARDIEDSERPTETEIQAEIERQEARQPGRQARPTLELVG
jgi:hypothetical protein